jgi:hypothetical protein
MNQAISALRYLIIFLVTHHHFSTPTLYVFFAARFSTGAYELGAADAHGKTLVD